MEDKLIDRQVRDQLERFFSFYPESGGCLEKKEFLSQEEAIEYAKQNEAIFSVVTGGGITIWNRREI